MRNVLLSLLLLLAASFLPSCSGDDAAANPDDGLTRPYEITVIFTPNGLGDMGYNDLSLQGLQNVYKNHTDIWMYFNAPRDMAQAERIFREWAARPATGRSLCILTTSDFEDMASDYFRNAPPLPEGKEVLLFESDNPGNLPVKTFRISLYGASFLAGELGLEVSGVHLYDGQNVEAVSEEACDGGADYIVCARHGGGGGADVRGLCPLRRRTRHVAP